MPERAPFAKGKKGGRAHYSRCCRPLIELMDNASTVVELHELAGGPTLEKRLTIFCYPVSRGFCEGAAAVNANLRLRISIKLRM